MRANKRIFWISVISFIISVLILVGTVILKYELHKCCIKNYDEVIEIIKNIFISIAGGAVLSFFTSWVAFSNKRKEYIISFCENYHTIFNIVMDIENWYSHWENRDIFGEEIYYDKILGEEVKQKVLSDKNKQSIRDILQLFERIRNFDYSCMSMVIDDYCSLFKKNSKERLKLKEMMGVISKVDYAYNSEEGLKFSLYRLNSYEESYMYEYFLKEKRNDVTFAFSNMPTLQSDLVKMTKINTYLKKINSDSKGKK